MRLPRKVFISLRSYLRAVTSSAMEKIYGIVYNALLAYGELGIALGVIILLLFVVQLIFHLGIYGRVASFRITSRKKIRDEEPPISVVVAMFSEDMDYLDDGLMQLLEQDYTNYEVVVVYVGDNDDFFAELNSITRVAPHLTPVRIRTKPNMPVKRKIAINLGIKCAKNDFILMTTVDAKPSSSRWLSLLAKGFLYGDIVLGYSGIAYKPGFDNFVLREYRLSNSISWLSAAIRRKTYSASHSAFGFIKEAYLGVRGFEYLNMNAGEDDLFVQQIATKDNVSVVLAPNASCFERTWGGWRWWIKEMSLLRLTHRYYPRLTLAPMFIEQVSRVLFFACALIAFALMPWEYCVAVGVVLFLRYFAVMFSAIRIWRRLGESHLVAQHFIYDIIEPFVRLYVILSSHKISKNAWRV